MRALVITPTPTHPTNQGNRARVLQISSALKQAGFAVELLYYAIDGLNETSVRAMQAAWDALYIVPLAGFQMRRRHPAYWGLDDWVSPQVIEAVRFLAGTRHYDIVVVNYVWCSALLSVFDGSPTVRLLETHDAFGDRHIVSRAAGVAPHWFYTTVAEEARGLDRADVVLAIQAEEAAYFRGITRRPVEVIEYAVAPSYLPWRPGGRLNVGYLGSGNPWNVESIARFDRLLSAQPADSPLRSRVNFLLFGSITCAVKDLRVFEPMGMVNEASDAYAVMDLVVNPMVGGTGLKIKTVEALVFGRPVISTKAGGTGLESIHPELLHETIEDVAKRVAGLAMDFAELGRLREEMLAGYGRFHSEVSERLQALLRGAGLRKPSLASTLDGLPSAWPPIGNPLEQVSANALTNNGKPGLTP